MVINEAEEVILDIEFFAEVRKFSGEIIDGFRLVDSVAVAKNLFVVFIVFCGATEICDLCFVLILINNGDLVGFWEDFADDIVFGTGIGDSNITFKEERADEDNEKNDWRRKTELVGEIAGPSHFWVD